jgi:hypothetical protein
MISPSGLCMQKETNKLQIREPQREIGKRLLMKKNGSKLIFRLRAVTWMVLRAGLLSLVSRALILLCLSSSFPGLSVPVVALPLDSEDASAAVAGGEASKSISRRSKGTK